MLWADYIYMDVLGFCSTYISFLKLKTAQNAANAVRDRIYHCLSSSWSALLASQSPECGGPSHPLPPLPVGRQKGLRIYFHPMWQIHLWPAPWFILAWAWLGDEIHILWGATASRGGESWLPQNSSLSPSTQLQNGGARIWPFPAFWITQWNPPIGFKFPPWAWKGAQMIQIPLITDRSTLAWGAVYKAMQ